MLTGGMMDLARVTDAFRKVGVKLTPSESAVFLSLAKDPNRIRPYDDMFVDLKNYTAMDAYVPNVSGHIKRIRKKWEGGDVKLSVRSAYGIGYALDFDKGNLENDERYQDILNLINRARKHERWELQG